MPEFDPRNRTGAQPDVVTRMMLERLARGGAIYKLARMVKRGPLCPAAVLWLETGHEPGCPENDMRGTRPRHVAGFVSGQYAAPERVYESAGPGTREIGRAEYDRLLAEITAAVAAGRYHPCADPYKPVDLDKLDLPFGGSPDVRRRDSPIRRTAAAQ